MDKILIVDDEKYMRELIVKILNDDGYSVFSAEDAENGLKVLDTEDIDIILSDIRMPGKLNGIEFLKEVKAQGRNEIFLIMTAYGSVENAVEAMQIGAFDYIQKPFTPDELRIRIRKACEQVKLNKEILILKSEKTQKSYEMIGSTPEMTEIKNNIKEVGKTDFPVLITGESGTGKELVARHIHENSKRKDQPFIAINVSTLNANLVESELFGYEKGAFTGANSRSIGKFELADKGTLFLDEMGELDLALQTKLLRVIQEKEFYRVGGNTIIRTNARIVAATNKNLSDLIAKNKFREDLYYRLNVYPIELPSLTKRKDDIPLLVDHFVKKHSIELERQIDKIDDEVYFSLKEYPWKGNIRELENIIIRMLIRSSANRLSKNELPEDVQKYTSFYEQKSPVEALADQFLEFAEQESEDHPTMIFIESLLAKRMYKKIGEKQKSAQMLGISKPTFFKWLRRDL